MYKIDRYLGPEITGGAILKKVERKNFKLDDYINKFTLKIILFRKGT